MSEDRLDEDCAPVRPYAVVGGRTRVREGLDLPIEALVRGLPPSQLTADPTGGWGAGQLAPEQRRIVDLTANSYVSVAELSAHLHLPIGVIRVVVADLLDAGRVTVHGTTARHRHAVGLDILEGVLDGITGV